MEPTQQNLESLMESLSEAEWRNARIIDSHEEYRILYTLIATSVSDGRIYYYEPDDEKFIMLNL
jgi:hypothetical protein